MITIPYGAFHIAIHQIKDQSSSMTTSLNDISINEIDLNEDTEVFLVYIMHFGTNADGLNVYHLLFDKDPENTFTDAWAEKPACLTPNNLMMPDSSQFECVKEMRTTMTLDLAQDNCCYSMQDCRDHCIALASENLDAADEYPEPFRIVLQFGEPLDEIERRLARRNILLDDV